MLIGVLFFALALGSCGSSEFQTGSFFSCNLTWDYGICAVYQTDTESDLNALISQCGVEADEEQNTCISAGLSNCCYYENQGLQSWTYSNASDDVCRSDQVGVPCAEAPDAPS